MKIVPLRVAPPLFVPAGLITSGIMSVVAQLPALSPETMFLQYGALGILGATIYGLFRVILQQQKSVPEIAKSHRETTELLMAKWDEWEKVRHADSEHLNTTLTNLSVTCAQRLQK